MSENFFPISLNIKFKITIVKLEGENRNNKAMFLQDNLEMDEDSVHELSLGDSELASCAVSSSNSNSFWRNIAMLFRFSTANFRIDILVFKFLNQNNNFLSE